MNRGYILNSKKYVKSEADKWFQSEFKNWAYSIFNRVETEEEEEDSLEKLHKFMDYEMNRSSDLHDDVVNPILLTNSLNFLTKSIIPVLGMLCFRHFIDVPYAGAGTNSFSESANGALKGDEKGPKPNHKLDRAAEETIAHTDRRFEDLTGKAKRRLTNETHSSLSEILIRPSIVQISKHVVPKKVREIAEQWSLSNGNVLMLLLFNLHVQNFENSNNPFF